MELAYLEEFIDLADSLSFTKTAENMNVAQPTLSKHIVTLEKELGAPLLARTRSKVELSKEGYYFLGVARGVVASLKEAQETMARIRAQEDIYVFGRFDDPTVSSLVAITSAGTESNGQFAVHYGGSRDADPLQLLLDREVDVVLDVVSDRLIEEAGLAQMPLMGRHMVAVMSPDNPLAKRQSVRYEELKGLPFVAMIQNNFNLCWDCVLALCEKKGFMPDIVQIPAHSDTEAITRSPKDSVLVYPQNAEVLDPFEKSNFRVAVPIEDDDAVFMMSAIYRTEDESKLHSFLEALKENVPYSNYLC